MRKMDRRAKITALALLVVMVAAVILPAAIVQVTTAQAYHEAWFKIVTSAWKGTHRWEFTGFPGTGSLGTTGYWDEYYPPVFPIADQWGIIPARYNLTKIGSDGIPTLEPNVEVAVYYPTVSDPNPIAYTTFTPNGTGFVKVTWPKDWQNVTIAVKAKSWYGEPIRTSSNRLYEGIILFMIKINATRYEYVRNGITSGTLWRPNATFMYNGRVGIHPFLGMFDFRYSGPVVFWSKVRADSAITDLGPGAFAAFHANASYAFLANCSILWKKFHTHTWYGIRDNLSYAQVRVYDLNYTANSLGGVSALSEATLVGAGVTKALYRGDSKLRDAADGQTPWIPIPTQTFHLGLRLPFALRHPTGYFGFGNASFPAGQANTGPHLNATVRVWWETVLVNQTRYSFWDNHTISENPDSIMDTYVDAPGPLNFTRGGWFKTQDYHGIAPNHNSSLNHLNCTVFYAKFQANDTDTRAKHRTFGDALVDAQVLIVLTKQKAGDAGPVVYFDKDEIGLTNASNTALPGRHPGYTDTVKGSSMVGAEANFTALGYMRFPNSSVFYYGGYKIGTTQKDVNHPWVLYDYPVVFHPEDAVNRAEALERPCTKIVNIKELNTISLDDDKDKWGTFKGILVQVKWKGGPAGVYGGEFVTVNSTHITNPYAIALRNASWIVPTNPILVRATHDALSRFDTPAIMRDQYGIRGPVFPRLSRGVLTLGGIYLLNCTVYDLMLQIVDKMLSPLEPADTKVVLYRPNGPPVEFQGLPTEHTVLLSDGTPVYNVVFYDWISANGTLLLFQLPGDTGAYGIRVYYQGVLVYDELFLIPKLIKTENLTLVTNVYKVLIKVTDAHDEGLAYTPVWYIHPTYGEVLVNTADDGKIDLGKTPIPVGGGVTLPTLKFTGVYWKGVKVKFLVKDAVKYPDGTTADSEPDGSVFVDTSKSAYTPIIVRARITDLIFYTWDFQKVEKINNVNITMSWWGYNITTGKIIKFIETMDPGESKDVDPTKPRPPIGVPWDLAFDLQNYNTSRIVAQFFRYKITYYMGEAKVVFHQMPALDEEVNRPCINVTTSTMTWRWTGSNHERKHFSELIGWAGGAGTFAGNATPGSNLWDSVTTAEDEAHGRVVLRVIPKAFNPDVYYEDIIKALKFEELTFCQRIAIDLPLWAMGFDVVAINGERWLGGAEFTIVNDVNRTMITLVTKSDAPITLRSIVNKTNPLLSRIWWNSSSHWTTYNLGPSGRARIHVPVAGQAMVGAIGRGYRTESLTFKTDMGVTVRNFTWYRYGGVWAANIGPWPDRVSANYTFYVTPNVALKDAWATKKTMVRVWVWSFAEGTMPAKYDIPYIYDKQLLRVPLPVGFITLELTDQGGARPLKYAFVNITAHINATVDDVWPRFVVYPGPDGKAQWAGKVDSEGKAEIIAPTAGYLNYTSKKFGYEGDPVRFKTFNITVYWYLNSSVVYEAYFNLTKMGWKVDKVAVADVVLHHTICSDLNRVVKGLYADVAWRNVTAPANFVHPGILTADDEKWTWTLTEIDETKGKAAWTTGTVELNLVPTAMKFKVYDWFLQREVTWNVSHLWRVAAWYTDLKKGPVQFEGESYKQLMFGSGTDKSPVNSAVYIIIGAAPFDHTTYRWTRASTDVLSGWWPATTGSDADGSGARFVGKIGRYHPVTSIGLIDYYGTVKTKEVVEATRTVKLVALKLNATDLAVKVAWQRGENETATYITGPLVGWKVKLTYVPPYEYLSDAERDALWTAWRRTLEVTTDDEGFAWFRSGDTPETVIWNASRIKAGMTREASWLVVSPPAYMLNEKDPYWRDNVVKPGAEAHGLSVFEGTQDPAAMVGVDLTPEGYFSWLPDPSLWVSDEWFSTIYSLYGYPGMWTFYNEWGAGLWLPSLFGEGYSGSSGWARIAGAWYARINVWPNNPATSQHVPYTPVFQYMEVTAQIRDFNGRPLPGAFFWMIDSVTGKTAGWSYAGKDGLTEKVYLRKPEFTLLLRVHYLGRDAEGHPAWPFNAFGKWPASYYSDADETEPGPGIFGELAKRVKVTTLAHEYHGVWRVRPGVHWDITARIFDIRVRHYYETAKPIEVDATFYREFPDKLGGTVEFKAKEIIEVKRLNRGTYEEIAKWLGVAVGRKSFDLSAANVGTVAAELECAVGDISVTAKDITGRVLSDAIAKFEGVEQKLTIPPEILEKYGIASEEDAKTLKAVGAVFVTRLPIPTNIRYSLDLSWTSPDFGTDAKVSVVDTVSGLNARREITLPVGVVTINVVDGKGRAIAGAEVSLGPVKAKTDAAGKAVFESVPLEREGRGIAYQITVTREGEVVYRETETFSVAKTSITVIGELYDLSVLVKGAAGQGLPFATVTLKRAGVVVGHFTTDEGGAVTIPKLVAADYEVEVAYKGYTGTATISKADLTAGKRAEVTLPPYVEIAGMPLTFATFLALIIGIVLLVIVVVVIAFEYVRWRGRRVGIFPPPPPKK